MVTRRVKQIEQSYSLTIRLSIRRSRSDDPAIRRSGDPAIQRSRSVDLTLDPTIRQRSDLDPTIRPRSLGMRRMRCENLLISEIRKNGNFLHFSEVGEGWRSATRRLSACGDFFLLVATFCLWRLSARGEVWRWCFNKTKGTQAFPA